MRVSFLEHVVTKPQLYTYTGVLSELLLFMSGYILALRHVDRENSLLDEWWSFLNWLNRRLELNSTASWSSQLVNLLGDSREAVDKLSALYLEFSAIYGTPQIRDGALEQ